MLESNVSRDFIERIDESQRALISKMVTESTFVAPTVASFAISEQSLDESRIGIYSTNV